VLTQTSKLDFRGSYFLGKRRDGKIGGQGTRGKE